MIARALLVLLAVAAAATGFAASTPEAGLERARNARAEGLAVAAVAALQDAIGEAPDQADPEVVVELARCLLDVGREAEAAALLERAGPGRDPELRFWLAQSLAQAGESAAALEIYETMASGDDRRLAAASALGRARALHALGRLDEALAAWGDVPDDTPWAGLARLDAAAALIDAGRADEALRRLGPRGEPARRDDEIRRYLAARAALDLGDTADAEARFAALAPRNRRLAAGAAIGVAEAMLRRGDESAAEEVLENFIAANPRIPGAADLMRKLDEVYAKSDTASNAQLKRWENDESRPAIQTLSTFFLALNDDRQGRRDRAKRTLAEFLVAHPAHPLRGEAASRLARWHLDGDELVDAVRVLREYGPSAADRATRGEIEFLWGEANFQAGNHLRAAEYFDSAARVDPSLAGAAQVNAALSRVAAGLPVEGDPSFEAVAGSDPEAADEILLAAALELARQGAPSAPERLAAAASRQGASAERARLALAEWSWLDREAGGPVPGLSHLVEIGEGSDDELAAHAEYFRVFVEDDGSLDAVPRVVGAAEAYLAGDSRPPHEAEVRMKLGEVLGRSGDHRAARLQFELAAGAARDAGLAEAARFLAARAAEESMDEGSLDQALVLYEEVARDGGALADGARIRQALVLASSGKPDEAMVLLDRLAELSDNPRVVRQARMRKADLLFELAAVDPARYREASEVWKSVAAEPDAEPAERNEALTKMAVASEMAGDFDAAVAGYYAVLDAPRDAQPEYFWFYKAGFDAGRLLESRNLIREAIAIYDKMASVEGPRSEEARERMERLRLENFIWEN